MKHLKEEFDKLTFKESLVYGLAIASLIAGFVLLFIGFFTAPEGEIHESVITIFGMVLLFVGSLLGISMHYGNELNRFKQTVTEMLGTGLTRSEALAPNQSQGGETQAAGLSHSTPGEGEASRGAPGHGEGENLINDLRKEDL